MILFSTTQVVEHRRVIAPALRGVRIETTVNESATLSLSGLFRPAARACLSLARMQPRSSPVPFRPQDTAGVARPGRQGPARPDTAGRARLGRQGMARKARLGTAGVEGQARHGRPGRARQGTDGAAGTAWAAWRGLAGQGVAWKARPGPARRHEEGCAEWPSFLFSPSLRYRVGARCGTLSQHGRRLW
jgi:hypothetical protein